MNQNKFSGMIKDAVNYVSKRISESITPYEIKYDENGKIISYKNHPVTQKSKSIILSATEKSITEATKTAFDFWNHIKKYELIKCNTVPLSENSVHVLAIYRNNN